MKMMSVSDVKKGRSSRRELSRSVAPREGTRTRELYDMFLQNRGIPVVYSHTLKQDSYLLSQLVDRYGLDIRRIDRGLWVLAGEWFGKNYVDYIAAVVTSDAA